VWGFFPLGRVLRDQNRTLYCHEIRVGGTLMRHGSWAPGPVPLLPEGMTPGSLGGLLVFLASRPDQLTPADSGALSPGAVPLPPVAPATDADLFAALPAMEDPVVALVDRPRTRDGPGQLRQESEYSPEALLQSDATETRAS